ncbi:hypothetical protein PV10_08536 [Exophiala mesophila]|uniref:Major facilitator superfamily (MFS) profile domain-containing protein n=1 Tax=Exophiala mesophila TaxID=212818 RepID=A0A0D1Z281_EXOME|nr:uncharacterized protein PV10_08536 [Exophiala mesophila]KIV88907.1 hypothetical protein PV10_08536 [Exophiala mesophila]
MAAASSTSAAPPPEPLDLGEVSQGQTPATINSIAMPSQDPKEVDVSSQSPLDEPTHSRSIFRIATVMVTLFCTLFLSALNTTIIATAIPTICSDLGSAAGYSWIGASYVIAATAVVSIWAKLSDIWGRKPFLLLTVALYFVSSIVCALSNSMGMLIVGRALQGISGGGLGSLVIIVISDLFSIRRRSLFLGLLHVTWAVAGGLGPVLGGAFTEYLSWRWIFWINLPICGPAFILLFIFLDVHNPKTELAKGIKAIDWAGSVCMIAIMVMVLLGLNFGGATYPWDSPKVICLVVVGGLMTFAFVFNEGRIATHPILPLKLFRRKSEAACLAIGFLQHFVLNAAEYYLPLYFQAVREASPLGSGVLILPLIITEALTAVATGIIIHQSGRYMELIWGGVVLLTLGNGLYITFGAASPLGSIIAIQIVAGVGVGLLFDPPLIALQALVSQEDTAIATATLSFVRSIGVSLSIVIGGVVFQNGMGLQKSKLQDLGLSVELADVLSGPSAAINIDLIRTISDPLQKLGVKAAYALSLRNLWILCTGIAACSVFAVALIARKDLSRTHTETRTGIKEKGGNVPTELVERDSRAAADGP